MSEEAIKVLIVEDVEGIVVYMHKMLVLKGYKTFTALDGPKAVEIFEKERPQISILDVHLTYSPIDGVEVLEKIKAIDEAAVCIMVTRITDEAKIQKAKELGAAHYLLKPIDTKDMVSIVNEAADGIRNQGASDG